MSEQTTANSSWPCLGSSSIWQRLWRTPWWAYDHERLVASGLVWKPGVVITASDALEADDDISVIAGAGKPVSAQFAGRDPTTDVAVLRLGDSLPEPATMTMSEAARVGQMVLALGRGEDGVIANLGMVSVAGGPWQSMRGGNIDSLIRLDMRLSHRAQGGLVVDSEGRVLGMTYSGRAKPPLSSRCQRSSVLEPSCSRTAAFGADIWALACMAFVSTKPWLRRSRCPTDAQSWSSASIPTDRLARQAFSSAT